MASERAILRAALAQKANAARPGAAQNTPPPQGQWIGAYSPAALNSDTMAGYAPSYGPFLPRPSEDFTAGAFGPFSPILPVPVDQPPPGALRPQPRRWQPNVGYNLPVGEPGADGYKLTSFANLKSLAELYSILRAGLNIRKDEIRGLDWDIVLTKDAAKAYKGDREAMRDFGERRAKALKWFRRPDKNYTSFASWFYAVMEEVFVYDALSLYLCPTKGGRKMGKGLLGSGLDSLWLVTGSSIRPLMDLHGGVPQPPAPAFQQYEFGVPRADFMTIAAGLDLQEAGLTDSDLAGEYRGDQLLYMPYMQRADSPYGMSLVEQALLPIMTGLRKQAYQFEFFAENSVPAVYISPGDASMTPNQIRELQDALNAVAGDIAWRYKVIVLPPGSKTMPQKDIAIVDQSDEWIATEVLMLLGVSPMEVGILPKISTVASPFAAREMAQASRTIHQRVATKPTLNYFQEIFDFILQDVAGQDDMRFMFEGMEQTQDQAALTDMGIKQIQSGAMSIDEFRDLTGRVPWGLPETSEPVVFTAAGPIPLTAATQMLGLPAGSNGGSGPSSTLTPPNPTAATTGAHAAAQGHMQATNSAGMNRAGRPGSVTERQRSRGGRLAPTHAQGTGAPGRATGKPAPKAALAELQALGRHLRKGRAISTWEPVHLEPRTLSVISEDMAKGLSADQAVAMAEMVVKAATGGGAPPKGQQAPPPSPAQIAAAYGPVIAAAFAAAVTAAAALISAWVAGTLAVTAAVLASMILAELRKHLGRALDALWRAAWDAAVRHAQESAGSGADAEAVRAALDAYLATHGANWAQVISGTREQALIKAIKDAVRSGDPGEIAHRLEEILRVALRVPMIAVTEVTRAWNAALAKVYAHLGVTQVEWVTTSADPCPKCLEAQDAGPMPLGSVFPGVDTSEPPAHPNCRCELVPAGAHKSAKLTRHVMDNGQEYWSADGDYAAGGGASPPPAHNGDGLGTPVTYPALWPFPHRAAPQEPVAGGVIGATAGGEPPRWDGSEPFAYDRSLPAGDDGAWGQAAGRGSVPQVNWPAPYMDGWWPEPHGLGTSQAPATSIPGDENDRGRAPNAVGKAAATLPAFLHGAPKAKASAVMRMARANFPPDALTWMKGVTWYGPVEVPLDDIDWDSEKTWASYRQQGKVDEFAHQLKAGAKVDPAIMIVRPGHRRARILDGHHRSRACRKLGIPSRAYVGVVSGRAALDAAYELHSHQLHQGDSPRNKSFTAGALGIGSVSGLVPYNLAGQQEPPKRKKKRKADKAAEPYVAGLMVRAGDTGRVLMLQRAITEDDPAAGLLEPPGGHVDTGETLLQGALREWAEEVGHPVPQGSLAGSWTSSDGIYRGFILDVPAEDAIDLADGRDQVLNPDNPDGDVFEAAIWVDPELFPGNPMMRTEMQRDLPQVMAALRGEDARKSARTPELSTVHAPIGHEGVWHSKHPPMQLPAYIQNVRNALMRDGHDEQSAHALAVNAVKEWAQGHAFGGKVKVTPTVQAAARRAVAEWEKLRRDHP